MRRDCWGEAAGVGGCCPFSSLQRREATSVVTAPNIVGSATSTSSVCARASAEPLGGGAATASAVVEEPPRATGLLLPAVLAFAEEAAAFCNNSFASLNEAEKATAKLLRCRSISVRLAVSTNTSSIESRTASTAGVGLV